MPLPHTAPSSWELPGCQSELSLHTAASQGSHSCGSMLLPETTLSFGVGSHGGDFSRQNTKPITATHQLGVLGPLCTSMLCPVVCNVLIGQS